MNYFERIAEQIIKKAMAEGRFEGLNGYGKPLDLNENPFEPEEQRLAFHILRNSGYTLPWLERKAEIDRTVEAFRASLRLHLEDSGKDKLSRPVLEKINADMAKINQMIIDYNLSVPLDSLQCLLLDLDSEINKASVPPAG
jgi:DnaJ family protein C protein 28